MEEAADASQVWSASGDQTLDAFSELVHLIYDAGLNPHRWAEALAQIAESMGATKGLLLTPGLAPHQGGVVFRYGVSEKSLQTLSEQAPGLPGTVVSVFRGKDAEPFSEEDEGWLRRLLPHISRSLGLMQQLEMHRAQKASTQAAFDRLPFGVALLNESRKVIHLNKSAEHAMARRDGLAVNDRGMLEGQGAKRGEGTLQGWLARFADQAETDPAHLSDGFAVARYILQCAPVASEGSWDAQAGEVRFVVFITDPTALTLPAASRLSELYGLTPTQARIALEFARGHSYKQAARHLRISEETVRSHVKVIYPRTGVNRQADLVRLVLSVAQVRI